MNNFTFFWGWDHEKGYLSNFFYCPYFAAGIRFTTSEQEFMYRKALFFSDEEIAQKILLAGTPKAAKALGRKVKNYNEVEWGKARYGIMYSVLYNKFHGNQELLKKLLAETKPFAEASPYDKIWGIGLKETDSRANDQLTWLGMNLLGQCLNAVKVDFANGNIK